MNLLTSTVTKKKQVFACTDLLNLFSCTTSFYFFFLRIRPLHTHKHLCVKEEYFLLERIKQKRRRHGRKGWPGVTDRSRGIKSRSGPTDITRRVMKVVWYDCFFFLLSFLFFFYDFDLLVSRGKVIFLFFFSFSCRLTICCPGRSVHHHFCSSGVRESEKKGGLFFFYVHLERSRTSDDLRGTRMKHTAPPVDNARAPRAELFPSWRSEGFLFF
jgi:hypothetical protein